MFKIKTIAELIWFIILIFMNIWNCILYLLMIKTLQNFSKSKFKLQYKYTSLMTIYLGHFFEKFDNNEDNCLKDRMQTLILKKLYTMYYNTLWLGIGFECPLKEKKLKLKNEFMT